MTTCNRCHRVHSGICGIPAGVVLGFGARIGGISKSPGGQELKGKPKTEKKGVSVLHEMLIRAHGEEKLYSDMLRDPSVSLIQLNELLDKLDKVEMLILQLNQQIAVRETHG